MWWPLMANLDDKATYKLYKARLCEQRTLTEVTEVWNLLCTDRVPAQKDSKNDSKTCLLVIMWH